MLKNLTSVFNCASTICKLVILCTIIKTLIAENVTSDCVFSSSPQQINEATVNTDFDAYVPYRSDQHDQFSWSLLKEILLEEQRNVITSPFSVKLVVALLSEAAGNNTKTQKELYTTLKDPSNERSQLNLRSFYKMILSSLKKKSQYYTLNLETKLYADEFIKPQQKYAAMLHTFYDTHIENIQFSDSETSADTINKWCRNVTNGRLPQLVNEDNIQNSVLLMANVIYFSGIWRRQFNNTFQGVFFKSPNEQLKVDFMEQTEYFYYYDSVTLDAKILRLPYKGRKLSMFILLPKTKAGLDELTNDLEINQLKRMQWMMDEVKVKVTMPKFNFDFDKDIKETLIKMGINEIFTYNASLAGLARGIQVANNLKVSNIFQKAGIDVNENGTEAFAATVVEIENKFGGSSLIEEFNVNRPFIFFIEEEATGSIIFAGKVLEPVTQ